MFAVTLRQVVEGSRVVSRGLGECGICWGIVDIWSEIVVDGVVVGGEVAVCVLVGSCHCSFWHYFFSVPRFS